MPFLKNNHLNQRFSRLLVIAYSGGGSWLCECDCGNQTTVQGHHLRGSRIKSCGCYRNEFSEIHLTTHGKSKTSAYAAWKAMVNRCTNPESENYRRYGGRGIKVCDRWLASFDNFLADMGERPDGLTLDRRDNNGNYELGNCRWVTMIVQSRNRENNLRITIDGETKTLTEWCEIYDTKFSLVRHRIERGWGAKNALLTPSWTKEFCSHGSPSSTPCAQCEQEIEATT